MLSRSDKEDKEEEEEEEGEEEEEQEEVRGRVDEVVKRKKSLGVWG